MLKFVLKFEESMDLSQCRKIILLHISVPLIFGIAIYALWRGIFLFDPMQSIFPLQESTQLPNWIKFNLPDGLWFYAFLSTIFCIWKDMDNGYLIIWLLVAMIMSAFLEIGQACKVIQGTFDFNDLLAYFAGSIFFFLNFHKKIYNSLKTYNN